MNFQYTDEHLNNLNQDYAVYSVNEEFSSRKKTKQVVEKSNIDPKNETNTITTSDDQESRVVATKYHRISGFDAVSVTIDLIFSILLLFIFKLQQNREKEKSLNEYFQQ